MVWDVGRRGGCGRRLHARRARLTDRVRMMTEPTNTDLRDQQGSGGRRGALGAVLGLGGLVLVVGGFALYTAVHTPAPAAGSGTSPKGIVGNAATAVEAGLDAAAKYQSAGKLPEAAAILAKLAEAEPTDGAVRRAFAQVLLGQKQYADAYAQYEAAVALLPAGTTERIAKQGDPEAAELHFEAGTCASLAGLLGRAEEHYSMAQTADRRNPKYPLYLAMVQLKKGDKQSETAATASLLRAVHLNPDVGEAWGTLGEVALRNDQLTIAEQHLEKARKLQPEVVRWRMDQARLLNRRGEAERAAALLTALSPEQRSDPIVLGVLAESYGLMRKPAEAATAYAAAFKAVSPPSAELAYQAALWFERAGEAEQAKNFAKTAAMLGNADAKDLAARLDRGS